MKARFLTHVFTTWLSDCMNNSPYFYEIHLVESIIILCKKSYLSSWLLCWQTKERLHSKFNQLLNLEVKGLRKIYFRLDLPKIWSLLKRDNYYTSCPIMGLSGNNYKI